MSVVQIGRCNIPFKIIPQATLCDMSISAHARSLLFYLLSRPEDWRIQIKQLMQVTGCGRDRVYKSLVELTNARYCEKTQGRENGGFEAVEYTIYPTPDQHRFLKNQEAPLPENAASGESGHLGNKERDNKKGIKTLGQNDHFDRDSDNPIPFERFWEVWPKKVQKKAARRAWEKIKPNQLVFDQIIANLEARANAGNWQNPRFIPNPATYLNGEQWLDVVYQENGSTKNEQSDYNEVQRRAAEAWRRERTGASQPGRADGSDRVVLFPVK